MQSHRAAPAAKSPADQSARCGVAAGMVESEPADLDVSTRWVDDRATVLAVTGEIDLATAPRLWDGLAAAILVTRERLVVDLSATTYLDSSALAVFVRAFNALRRQGADLVLRAPNTSARKVLAITGLDGVFTIEDGPSILPVA